MGARSRKNRAKRTGSIRPSAYTGTSGETYTAEQVAGMLAAQRQELRGEPVVKTYGNAVPQQIRVSEDAQGMLPDTPFSPGEPIGPYYGYSRTPRSRDFPAAYNIAARPRLHERVAFDVLKGLINSYDIAQICIRHRIASIRSLDWKLIAADGYTGDVKAEIDYGKAVLYRPDRRTLFRPWLAKFLRGVLSYDAGTLYRMRNRGGRVIGLKVIDGTTIAPLVDYWGDPPEAPAPSHVQYVQGLPWNWLTSDDLIYQPFDPQDDSIYGRAPLEDILLNANTDIRFQLYFLQRFTAGNLPAAFASAPETWTPQQIDAFQEYWDAFMLGQQEMKHQVRWIPGGSKFAWSDEKDFSDIFSLFLMRKTCAAFHVVPADLGFTECYSEDTECLTDRGWLRHDELLGTDRVATYNPLTREIEYHVPVRKFTAPYEGEMVRFKSRSQDILVTPGHRMWAWTQTRDRAPGKRPWREIRADQLAGMSRFGFVGHAVFDAPDIDEVVLRGLPAGGHAPVGDRRIPMDLWLEFLGYMIAEGCVHRQNRYGPHYNVSISQSNRVNREKVERFTRCLEQLPVSWTVRDHERDGCRVWSVGDKSLWTWLERHIGQGSRGKHLPGFFRRLGKRQVTILLEALLLGDGTVDGRPQSTGREYGTMSAQLASDVQELAFRLGFRVSAACNGIGFWRVNITDGRDHQLGRQQVTREPYKGTVWCVEVPNHLFVTRRNGKVAVQGNSVNRSSGESQADVQHRVGDLPLAHHVQDILTAFLQDDLQLPLRFAFDLGEEQDDRVDQAQADKIYVEMGAIGPSDIRELRYGLSEPGGRPVPRFIYTSRSGPIPLSSLFAVAGDIDPETGAPALGAELPKMVFGGTEGVLPNPPIKVMSLAEREFGPAAMPPAPPPQPVLQAPEATDPQAVAKEITAGITSDTGITSYDLDGREHHSPDDDEEGEGAEPVAKEASGYDLSPRSGMISLDIPEGLIEPLPGGVTDFRCTVAYLGPDVDNSALAVALGRARDAAAAVPGPLQGTISGVGAFPPSDSSDGKVPAWAAIAVPGSEALREALGDLSASQFKNWVPHVTRAYMEAGDPLPPPLPPIDVTFTHLSVHRGDQVYRFPFGGGELAKAADPGPKQPGPPGRAGS